MDRLINNLRMLWVGRFHLQFNNVRYERPSLNKTCPPVHKPSFVSLNSRVSYANVASGPNTSNRFAVLDKPSLVLDDDCGLVGYFSRHVLGKVKNFHSINNIKVTLVKEGFVISNISYMGGLWVLIELENVEMQKEFLQHVGVNSWFQTLHLVTSDFVSTERIVWVDVEGIPLKLWSLATFKKIGNKWGDVMEIEEATGLTYARKRLCIKTKLADNILESFKITFKGKSYWVRAKELFTWSPCILEHKDEGMSDDEKEDNLDFLNDQVVADEGVDVLEVEGNDNRVPENAPEDEPLRANDTTADVLEKQVEKNQRSEDPFGIYDLLNQPPNTNAEGSTSSRPYPPGYTPVPLHQEEDIEGVHNQNETQFTSSFQAESPKVPHNQNLVNHTDEYSAEGSTSVLSRKNINGGFILDVLEDIIKVGQTMGYVLEGCTNDIEQAERFGSLFNSSCARSFNNFIGSSGLIDVKMEGKNLDTKVAAQKAKVRWAIEGDENSKLFHGIINKRRSQLAIREFPNHLSSDQIGDLDKPISVEEIKVAVWDCGENKSPGPDGYTFEFYRHFWDLISIDFCAAITYFFDHGSFPRGGNSSFIALIPKVIDAKFVNDFRPISLIGSVYKVVTKILATRLSYVIASLVSNTQSAFIKNRHILDGPFILSETIAWCKSKKKQALIFKVDFAKAYDFVRWDFLLDTLQAFGFSSKWCFWIWGIFSSNMASILVNGSPFMEFPIACGLKQGDPLVPFLFILVMESVHISVTRACNEGIFKGLRIHDSLVLSHLFYVDDAVFIVEWSDENLKNLVRILNCFQLASGLKINMTKSQIMGVGVPLDVLNQGASSIRCATMTLPFKYLGVTVGDQMSRHSAWFNVVQKINSRLSKWKAKTLSVGGSLTLIKAVLASVAFKRGAPSLNESFRRQVRGGIESQKWSELLALYSSVLFSTSANHRICDLNGE
nr:RNA-directed DNA polymerase, eukaryota [Tanacetum cinerariifolium]